MEERVNHFRYWLIEIWHNLKTLGITDIGPLDKPISEWISLIVGPIIIASGAIIGGGAINIYLGRRDDKKREQDREIERDRLRQEVLLNYFDQMTKIFLNEQWPKKNTFQSQNLVSTSDSPIIPLAKARTFATLNELDEQRKKPLLIFLYESEAIKHIKLENADLSAANLSDTDLKGVNLINANLSGAKLYGANLSRANLSGADLSGADLSGADLEGADLYGANLSRANLRGAKLYGANLSRANLRGADLSGARLYKPRYFPAFPHEISIPNFLKNEVLTLRQYNLQEWANFSRAYLSRANLSGAYLYRANLSRANLSRANLSGAYLSEANLEDANLYRANLEGANLKGANLSEANLEDANFSNADLQYTDLQYAQFSNFQLYQFVILLNELIVFRDFNFFYTNIRNANLMGANLIEATNLTKKKIEKAKNWREAYYSKDFCTKLGIPFTPSPDHPQEKSE